MASSATAGSAVPAALGKPLEDGAAMSRSSATRWPAPSKRCTFASGSRLMRSLRYRSEKIGSRGPHSIRAGTFSPRTPSATRLSAGKLGWDGVGGNVSDKVPHAGAAAGAPVRGHEGAADIRGQRRAGQGMRHAQEGVRRRRSPAVHGRVQGKPQGRRDGRAGGLVDGGVGQHDPGELLRMCQGPAEADHAAPVVADGDDRPVQPERGGEVAQVVDPVRQAPERAGALGEAHVQLVHRHHTPRMGGVGTGRQQGPPQVGPRRVAVHAQQGAGRRQAAAGELGTVVEQMPAAHGAGLIRGRGGRHIDFARPFGVDAGPVGGYQTISTMAVFRPEPTPMHSTRSPVPRVCASAARVIGQRGRAHIAPVRERDRHLVRVQVNGVDDGLGVGIAHLVRDVAVHRGPVPLRLGLVPGVDHELQAAVEQALGVGGHAVDAAHAQFMVLGAGAHHAAENPVRPWVLVRRAEDGRSGSGAEGECGELAVEVLAGRLGPLQPGQGGLLRCLGILAVDDQRVLDLAGVDHAGRQRHAVDESEAGVGQIEVHGRRRQA